MMHRDRLVALLFSAVLSLVYPSGLMSQEIALEGYDNLTPQTVFEQANDYYRQEKYEQALQGFTYLTQQGISNGYLFYNLGNTHFALGRLGEAILWYERAQRYLPRYEDLQVNFAKARQNLADDEFKKPEYTGTVGFFVSIHNAYSLRENFYLLVFFFWLLVACLAGKTLPRKETIRSWFRIPCWLLLLTVILLSLSFGMKAYRFEYRQEAIVMDSTVEIRTGPGEDLSVLFTIHEGTKVILAQEQRGWRRIYLPGNHAYTGWLPKASVKTI